MSYVLAGFLVVGFLVLMKVFGLVGKSLRVIHITRSAVSDLRDQGLDDDAKEALIQSHARKLFILFALISIGSAGAALIPVTFLMIGETLGIVSLEDALVALLSWEFMIPATVISIYYIWLSTKR